MDAKPGWGVGFGKKSDPMNSDMTIQKKIFATGAVVFFVFVVLASMSIWTHREVSSNLGFRDEVDEKLADIREFAKWKNSLIRLISDIVASGHVPPFTQEHLNQPFVPWKTGHVALVKSGQHLVGLIAEKEQVTTDIDQAFSEIRTQINGLYYKLDEKIATVLAIAQMDHVLGMDTSEKRALAPYVLKNLNQLTLVAMNGLISRRFPQEDKSVVAKNQRFVSSQLQLIDPDGSIETLFAELFAQIASLDRLILESDETLSRFEKRISKAKDDFDLAVEKTETDAIVKDVQSDLDHANEKLARASRRSLITVIIFLFIVPLFVIALGIFGLNTIILAPIANLMSAMKNVEDGQFDVAAPVIAQDEIGQLAQAFNVMAAEIKAKVAEMSRLNQVLRESESKYRTLVDNLPQRIFLKDKNLVYISCNRNFADDMKIAEEEIAGKTDFDFFPKALAEKYRHDDASILLEEKPKEIEETYDKDGKNIVVNTVKTPIRNDKGEVSGVLGIFWDITRRKEMESSLRLYQFVFDTAAIAIFLMNENGELLDVNKEACRSLGHSREDLCKMDILDIDPVFTPEIWGDHLANLRSEGVRNIETKHRRKSGEVFPVQVIDNIIAFEGREFHVAFVQDITERKRMEQELKESQERLDLALSGANEGIWDWYVDEGAVYFDSRYYTMAGYRPNEFPGAFEEWEKRVHKDDVEGVKSVIDQYMAGDLETYKVEFRYLRKNGSYMWIQGRGQIVEYNEKGDPVRFVGTHSDITDRKRMEEALEKRIVALTQPLEDVEGIAFEDLFNLSDIQRLQDLYAEAFGVAALITHPDGTPITRPSNFTTLCGEIIRNTEKGRKNCNYSDAMIGRHNPDGPNIQPCLSAGLCNAGASITVGGRHIANWLIGQVRNETQNEEDIMPYAREIGADETAFRAAYRQVPTMSEEQFERVAHVLFAVSEQLSMSAYQNVQQARFISQRRQAEEELRQLRNYLSNIINSMPSILVAVDRDGQVTQWNRQAEQITGVSVANAHSRPLADVFPRLMGEMENIKVAIRERRVLRDLKVPNEQGHETRYEDVTIYPLSANGVEGAVIRVDDVTERIRLEEMMIQSEKMLSVGGLAAGMAHEINNPLAGILQSASVLENRLLGDLPANQKAAEAAGTTMTAIGHYSVLRKLPTMLENIRASGTLAAAIVKNMLSFVRKSEKVVSSHDLGILMDQTIDLLKTDYDMKKHYDFKQIEIDRRYDEVAGPVPCEASKIQQVFMNILKNGAEAMAEVTDASAPPKFTLRVRNDGAWVRVEIEDNGPGMEEETRRRIFEPFFTTKPVGKGTGLGLSVSYFIIAEDHGGEMNVQAVDGGGTRFVIRLPKAGKG